LGFGSLSVVVNASKAVHLGSTTRFGDIVNLLDTFVIKFICLESWTQSNISLLQNPHMLMLEIRNTIWINKYNHWKNSFVFMLDFGPYGRIFLASSRNILTYHKKKKKVAWNSFKNIQWCDMEYVPKIFSCYHWTHSLAHCSLFVIHPLASLKFFIGIRFIFLIKPTIASLISLWRLKGHLKVSNLYYRASWAGFQTTTINMLATKGRGGSYKYFKLSNKRFWPFKFM